MWADVPIIKRLPNRNAGPEPAQHAPLHRETAMPYSRLKTEVLIIGSGIAGCTAALCLADRGHEVTLISSGPALDSGNTALAQGGIIYTGPNDSPELLTRDITVAGAEYNYTEAVRYLCEDGPKAVERILFERVGVPFERTANGECFLTREGPLWLLSSSLSPGICFLLL